MNTNTHTINVLNKSCPFDKLFSLKDTIFLMIRNFFFIIVHKQRGSVVKMIVCPIKSYHERCVHKLEIKTLSFCCT